MRGFQAHNAQARADASSSKNETVLRHPAIDGIVAQVVDIAVGYVEPAGSLSVKEYVALIGTIKNSVARDSAFGPRAYYEFIRAYV